MKRFIAFLLLIAVLTSSLLATFGLSTKYIMRPYEYIERLKTVFQNAPISKTEDVTFSEGTDLQYNDLSIKLPVWTSVEIDSIREVPKALGVFMNRSMTYVGAAVKEMISVIPRLFSNLKIAFSHYFGLVPRFIIYVGKSIKNIFVTKFYVKIVALSFVPLDWNEMKEDNVKIRIPWFGGIAGLPFEIYYQIKDAVEDIEPPNNENGEMPDEDNESGGNNNGVIDEDFNIDIYDPNANPDPDFDIPDNGGDNGNNDDIGQM